MDADEPELELIELIIRELKVSLYLAKQEGGASQQTVALIERALLETEKQYAELQGTLAPGVQ